jgi:hypothetical protein
MLGFIRTSTVDTKQQTKGIEGTGRNTWNEEKRKDTT